MGIAYQHTLRGDEKERYLKQLDAYLASLGRVLSVERKDAERADLVAFAKEHDWDLSRLPAEQDTYKALSRIVGRVRNEYRWFRSLYDEPDPANNRAHFTNIEMSAVSGMPSTFAHVELHQLRRDAQKTLATMPEYAALAADLSDILLHDEISVEDVREKAKTLVAKALDRSYIEQLQQAKLLDWQMGGWSDDLRVSKKLALGGETLWNLELLRYRPSDSMFEAYIVDMWQDVREPQILESPDGVDAKAEITPALRNMLSYGRENEAWYILQDIDNHFSSLHPVHVSRALIGPFETKCLTAPNTISLLSATPRLLAKDPDSGILRFSRQYSYAPNHTDANEEFRQIIHRQSWRDEVIVCPTQAIADVMKTVRGTYVRIIEV